jgi:glycosyltransferase involved in cell wall biosynthesis
MHKPRLTVLVVARNEAHHLADCLRSASFADERVVLVDAASTDATLDIARRSADVVAERPFDNFANQRNAAIAMASGDWVLSIDADERVTPALADEIQRVLNDPTNIHSGFHLPIQSVVLGRPFGYSGTQHDLPLRLFRRDRGRWTGLVHETVDLLGSAGRLNHPLTHRTLETISVFLAKIDRYTSLEARQRYESGVPFRLTDLTLRPLWLFLKLYLGKQGFRDGLEGLMFCGLSGLSAIVRAWKVRELERLHGKTLLNREPRAHLQPAAEPIGGAS